MCFTKPELFASENNQTDFWGIVINEDHRTIESWGWKGPEIQSLSNLTAVGKVHFSRPGC